jgi:hypothetical protein
MFPILEVQQCPKLAIAQQNNIAPLATVTAVRSALGVSFGAVKMMTSCTSFSAFAANLYIVNKIGFSHAFCKGTTGSGRFCFADREIRA